MTEAELMDAPGARTARTLSLFRAAVGVSTLVMLLLSWPLWTAGDDAFPRVPFVGRLPAFSQATAWTLVLLLLAAVALAVAGFRWRAALAVGMGALLVLILGDQHRFQPWVYQFLMVGLLLVTLSQERALRYARWWYASLYLHSGLSKLDFSFCHEMGALFLETAARPFGLEPGSWPAAPRTAAILAMPAWEIAIAVALVVPRLRLMGLAGAVALHAALLGILGPLGLGHSTIVLVWNLAMMVEVAILFGPSLPVRQGAGHESVPGLATQALFWIAVIAPLGERSGWIDAWPSHALYASHVERTGVFLQERDAEALPRELSQHLGDPSPTEWRRLDLTGWSRAVRGVPVYPQGRACNGLAEAVAARYGGRFPIQVIHWSRADLWTGRRSRVECLGLVAIRRQADRYWINAHPVGALARAAATNRALP